MRKSRFAEEQMVRMLREADKTSVTEVAKKHGLSEQTLADRTSEPRFWA